MKICGWRATLGPRSPSARTLAASHRAPGPVRPAPCAQAPDPSRPGLCAARWCALTSGPIIGTFAPCTVREINHWPLEFGPPHISRPQGCPLLSQPDPRRPDSRRFALARPLSRLELPRSHAAQVRTGLELPFCLAYPQLFQEVPMPKTRSYLLEQVRNRQVPLYGIGPIDALADAPPASGRARQRGLGDRVTAGLERSGERGSGPTLLKHARPLRVRRDRGRHCGSVGPDLVISWSLGFLEAPRSPSGSVAPPA